MNGLLLTAGIFVLLVALGDAVATTLWLTGGAGKLTSVISAALWRVLMRLFGRGRHRALSVAGPLILGAAVLVWVMLLMTGWVLVFSAEAGSIVNAQTKAPADLTDRIYFVAYSTFTQGYGDFLPDGGAWQLAVSVMAGCGMLLVTLAVTYLVSVLSAVVRKRAFAAQVTGFGESAEAFVRHAWDGAGFPALDLQLAGFSSQLSTITEQHLAYPVLHYYHAAQPEKAPAIAVATLDEALTLLEHGVAPAVRPAPATLRAARQAISHYLATLESAHFEPADRTPPPPDLGALHEAGIPTTDSDAFARALEHLSARRRDLLGLVEQDAWRWRELQQ